MDLAHTEIRGGVESAEVHSKAKSASVNIDAEDNGYENVKVEPFAFSQMLKFTDLRKSDLKGEEGEVLPDAGAKVTEELADQSLVFKRATDTNNVKGVVSPKYVSIPSEEVEQITRETITSMGLSDYDFTVNKTGTVVEMDFKFPNEQGSVGEVGDTLEAGIHIRNSVFGASSLRVNQYFTVLACENGMLVRDTDSFRQVHMGDPQELRELLVDRVEEAVENIWEEVEFIDTVATIHFPIEEQIEFLEELADSRRITKQAASNIGAKIIVEAGEELEDYEPETFSLPESFDNEQTWNTGEDNVWSLLNAFTGYAEHSQMISDSSLKQVQRVYNDLMRVEDEDDVKAVA